MIMKMQTNDRTDTTAISRREFCTAVGAAALTVTSQSLFAAGENAEIIRCMEAGEVDMEEIAAPILERYNRERKPEDTWGYGAEYLEPDTFIVNARGLCLTREAFDRRDDAVYDVAKEIETAANKAAGIDPDDDDAWDCCEQCYWDENGDEIDDDPDRWDKNDTPLWKKIVTSQWMICCHY